LAEAGVALGVVGLVCAVYLSLAHYSFDILEEGYFATHARRVQLGGLPYRDFSTPYTPGVFYLYAWLMDHFGPSVIALRVVQVLGRGVLCLALYALGRRFASPFFAALAPALILAIDTAPALWSVHPGWLTAPASVGVVLAIAHYARSAQARWLFVAGIAAGVGFALKQNLAAYVLLAALWLLAVAEQRLPLIRLPARRRGRTAGWEDAVGPPVAPGLTIPRHTSNGASHGRMLRGTRIALQVLALAGLPLAALYLVRAYFTPLVGVVFVLPLAAVSLAAGARLLRAEAAGTAATLPAAASLGREASFYARPLVLLAGFGAVTLPWLVLLIRALDGRIELLAGFVGQIDLTGYFYGMDPPTADHLRLVGGLLLLPVAVTGLAVAGLWGRRGAALGLVALACVLLRQVLERAPDGEPWNVVAAGIQTWRMVGAAWQGFGASPPKTNDFILYVPVLAFWAGLGRLIWDEVRLERSGEWRADGAAGVTPDGAAAREDERAARDQGTLRLWLLAAGAALLLNQYPRMDEIHLLWSGGVIFVVGADVLHAWYRRLLRIAPEVRAWTLGRSTLRLSLALLPALAALPVVWYRIDGLGPLLPAPPAETHAATDGARGRIEPIDLPEGRGQVWLPAGDAEVVEELVGMLHAKTAPGEPIFTYPSIPGIYYLADRPNATRFNHLFPGFASPPEQDEMVSQLETVRYVVWDDGASHYWVRPGDNLPVTEYIQTHFRVERFIGPYAVLARDAEGPRLNYLPSRTG
jgi:hypothetical protein